MPARTGLDAALMAFAVENAELRAALREARDQAIELAVDADDLHAEVAALRREVAELRDERNACHARAVGHAS